MRWISSCLLFDSHIVFETMARKRRPMRITLVIVQIVVAALGVANIVHYSLDNLLSTQQPTTTIDAALAAIAALTIAGIAVGWKARTPYAPALLGLCIILTTAAGFAPRVVARYEAEAAARQLAQEDRRADQGLQDDLGRWSTEVDARMAAQRPVTGAEAWALLDVVRTAVLRDRSPEATALLQKAISGKVLDPNVPVQGKRPVDTAPRPLFLQFYKEAVEPGLRVHALRAADWKLMQILAAGADMADPDAAALATELGKTPKPSAGDFISLE